MAKTKKVATKRPSGLSITREGWNFICSWKIGDDNYGQGQRFYYKINTAGAKTIGWTRENITTGQTKKTIQLDALDYYPNLGKPKLLSVEFKVQGRKSNYHKGSGNSRVDYKPQWSAESSKKYVIQKPYNCSLTVTPLVNELINKSTFTWTTETSSTSYRMFTRTEWQTRLCKDSDVTDGEKVSWDSGKLGWESGTSTANNSYSIAESSVVLANDSATRWFRIRAVGAGGESEKWAYKRHVYARPTRAEITKASPKANNTKTQLTCKVEWLSESTTKQPIDRAVVQYVIDTPVYTNEKLYCPAGASWQDAVEVVPKNGTNEVQFIVDNNIGENQCLFTRVNNIHDSYTRYSLEKLCRVGKLSAPTGLSVNTSTSTVTATNTSTVTGSFLAVYYESATVKRYCCGIITNSSTVVNVPTWTNASISVQAIVGTYVQGASTTRSRYSITAKMKSDIVSDGGSVPKAPTGLKLDQVGNNVKVNWNWAWNEATTAEVTWSNDETAWESTEEPESYLIPYANASQWYIRGLEAGERWYVRVRLIKDGEEETIGPWSEVEYIDVASEPVKPSITIDKPVILKDESFSTSWTYVTTDGTKQAYAEIAEKIDINSDDDYVLTEDTTAKGNKYYIRSGSGTDVSPYKYKKYEVRTFVLTSDTTVNAEKDYYTRSGSGTAASPYKYTKVQVPTGNPHNKGWYTTNGTSSVNPHSTGLYEKNYVLIAKARTAQQASITVPEWEAGNTYNLCVRVTSQSGRVSLWSDTASIAVADPLTCSISDYSLVETTLTEDGVTRTVLALKKMPMTATVTGAGVSGTTTLMIERAEDYHVSKPDETEFDGYKNETIASTTQIGEAQISFDVKNLIGELNDGAKYRLVAIVQDNLNRSARDEVEFEVHWTHQAIKPTATAVIDTTAYIAKITPIAPTGTLAGDVCDIYRLSADRPELIVSGGTWGTTYVDPYPAIGEFGGHRVVFRSKEGDYVTDDANGGTPAWVDLDEIDGDKFDSDYTIIDFGGNQLLLYYNVDISSSWEKDFIETKYLGGSVQGDWNPAVSRTGSVSTVTLALSDSETIRQLRRLAVHADICHVRTRDGSSYAADIQVSESRKHEKDNKVVEFSLTITRIDTQGFDGMTLAEWNA